MSDRTSSYFSEIGGDFKGIQGDISGGVISQYIITQKSGIEIRNQRLITGSPYLDLRKFETDDEENNNISESDRHLCDGISTKNSPVKVV